MVTIKIKRATRDQLNSAASAGNLVQGEPYLITDEDRLAIGLSASSYEDYAKESEIPTGGGSYDGTKLVGINAQSGTTYTLAASDAGKLVRCNNADSITVTVPKNSAVAIDTNTVITIQQVAAGVVTVEPVDGDVTLTGFDGYKTAGQYAAVQLIKIDTDVWTMIGGVE